MREHSQKLDKDNFLRLTPKLAWQLAAPHTWPASIMPVLVATGCATARFGMPSLVMTFVLLAICVLMQSSVNTFNDYFDYVKGADSADDNVEVSDAVLVYNNIQPASALALAIGFLVCAFLLGIYVISLRGVIPLIIALIGACMVVLYSGGKTPISYLPLGELVSGFVMGGLIVLASYHALTGILDFRALIWALPTIIGVGLIMMTNNTCDIEKDESVNRHTLPVLLGRKWALRVYRGLLACWLTAIVVIIAIWFKDGLIVMPFMLLAMYPLIRVLWNNHLAAQTRIGAMGQICNINVALGAFYVAALLA